jgi:hypothetical protein
MKISISPEEYIDHPYNGTITNERTIEVAFGKRYLNEFNDIIEIGAVMPYYGHDSHLIYDPYDTHPKSLKEFAENIDVKDKNILSVSTIEHMGGAEGHGGSFRAEKPYTSVEFLERLLSDAKSFLVTLPVGQNTYLDSYFKACLNKYQWFAFEKMSQTPPLWISNNTSTIYNRHYGYPFPASNAVLILTKGIKYE